MKKDVIAWIGLALSILGLVFTAGMFYNRVVVVENSVEAMQMRSSADHAQMIQDIDRLQKSLGTIRDQLIHDGVDPHTLAQPMMPPTELRMPPLRVQNNSRVETAAGVE